MKTLKTFALVPFLVLGSAHAAVPAEVTAAIEAMKADGLVVASAVLVAIIAIAAVKFLRRAM